MKNIVFWDVVPCGFNINRRFGETYPLHLQGGSNNASEEKCYTVANRLTTSRSQISLLLSELQSVCCRLTLSLARFIPSTLKMEATRFSETSVPACKLHDVTTQ
jgi:hypothetical protein